MRLSSPTGPTVSVHRNTSFLRGCNPIEESKQELGSFQGIYCASMGEPLRDLDWKARQPRTYSHTTNSTSSFYPYYHSNQDSTSSYLTTMPESSLVTERQSKNPEPKKEESSSSSSSSQRKRKSSWSRGGNEEMSGPKQESERRDSGEVQNEIRMRPIHTSSPAKSSERLPGIAHLDEQMHTPWSIRHARRTVGLRSSIGDDDSLRRFSTQSFSNNNRAWRSSLPDIASTANRGDVPPLPVLSSQSIRRTSSPNQGHLNRNEQSHSMHHNRYAERPSTSPRGSGRSPSDNDHVAHSRLEDQRHHAAFVPYDSRDEPYSYSQDRRTEHTSEPYRYSTQPHSRETAQSSSSYSHQGSNDHNYSRRTFERDSPSYFEESTSTGGQQQQQQQQHQHQQRPESGNHSYSSPGVNTSPSVPRRRGKLPKVVTDLLKSWLLDHSSHPYPTEDEKRRLCGVTGLSISQVSNWFINARRRILVPQGSSSNFASGQQSTPSSLLGGHLPPSPPLHHLAPPHTHHGAASTSQQQHHHQDYHHATIYKEDSKQQPTYKFGQHSAGVSRSQSPDSTRDRPRRSFDDLR